MQNPKKTLQNEIETSQKELHDGWKEHKSMIQQKMCSIIMGNQE